MESSTFWGICLPLQISTFNSIAWKTECNFSSLWSFAGSSWNLEIRLYSEFCHPRCPHENGSFRALHFEVFSRLNSREHHSFDCENSCWFNRSEKFIFLFVSPTFFISFTPVDSYKNGKPCMQVDSPILRCFGDPCLRSSSYVNKILDSCIYIYIYNIYVYKHVDTLVYIYV